MTLEHSFAALGSILGSSQWWREMIPDSSGGMNWVIGPPGNVYAPRGIFSFALLFCVVVDQEE